jgi:hypothetical protein
METARNKINKAFSEEIKKCVDSPYYFAKSYIKDFNTLLNEEQYNQMTKDTFNLNLFLLKNRRIKNQIIGKVLNDLKNG